MNVKFTDTKEALRNASGEITTLHQIIAAKDFYITILIGEKYKRVKVREGTLGGFVEKGVVIGRNAWIGENVKVFGKSKIYGLVIGEYARIEDSIIHGGAIINGRVIICDSVVGHDVSLSGTTRIEHSVVEDNASVVGTVVRRSEIGKNANIKCSKTIKNRRIKREAVMLG